ncbi:MAG TPA: hypothetical protein VD993_13715 [Chitinophagaceae bacterium]|nr:hypothetical protein [Chitinophagaceae bacterium]
MKLFVAQAFVAAICCCFLFCGNNTSNVEAKLTAPPALPDYEGPTAGTIAYIRDETEIRLINVDGTNDRRLWTFPGIQKPLGLYDLAWRPDGKELAFSSGHEAVHSYYETDIYTVRPDGTGFRKITNPPDHKGLENYKKGSVSIRVSNMQYTFRDAQSSAGVFFLYIVGASEPQQITLPPGSSKTFVFKNVADFGPNKLQAVVAVYGRYRWFMPGTDVVSGANISAPEFVITGDGIPYFGAYRPVWKSDGSAITYRDGMCVVKTTPLNPPAGAVYYQPLFGKDHPDGACIWDLGPTPALADKILYSENDSDEGSGFYIMDAGGKHDAASRLTMFSNIRYQIANDVKWLPDGSGFLYSFYKHNLETGKAESNIFKYDFKTRKVTQITKLREGFARTFTISPDGTRIVYERCRMGPGEDEGLVYNIQHLEDVDLWMINMDGSGDRLLVKNGFGPAWGR